MMRSYVSSLSLVRKVSGFTLLEVLITFAIAGVLLVGLSQLTGTMLRGWDRSAARLEDQSAMFNAADKFAEEVSGSIPYHMLADQGIATVHTGNATSMMFVRPAIGFETSFNLNRVSYSIESGPTNSLLVRRSEVLDINNPTQTRGNVTRTVLADFAGKASFEYSGNGISFDNQWPALTVHPRAVRIRFQFNALPGVVYSKTAFVFTEVGPYCLGAEDGADPGLGQLIQCERSFLETLQ